MDAPVEEVHADEREVGGRDDGLFDEPRHFAGSVDLGDAELTRIVDPGKEDVRRRWILGRRPRRGEVAHQLSQALLQEVVA